MPPQVCARCGQTFHDEDPRWDCLCGLNRTGAVPPAFSAAAGDDPMTWYDHYSCFPSDVAVEPPTGLRRSVSWIRPMSSEGIYKSRL